MAIAACTDTNMKLPDIEETSPFYLNLLQFIEFHRYKINGYETKIRFVDQMSKLLFCRTSYTSLIDFT